MSEIPLSQPDITEAEIGAVVNVLRSARLTDGPRQARFEEMVADRCGRRHGLAVSCGTAGLQLVMRSLEIGPGDEVITSPFSYIAATNAICHLGAKPIFVDIEPRSLTLDPAKVNEAITPRTRAILAVDVFGNLAHLGQLAQFSRRHELALIEDCSEALGGVYHGTPAGGFGRAGIFGFHPNKQVTTGEGGMVVTDDDRMAELVMSLRNQGREVDPNAASEGWDAGVCFPHERLGYNHRLSEIACALGIAQMDRLDEILDARRRVAAMYIQRLMDWQELILPTVESPGGMSWFAFVVRLNDQYGRAERDRIIQGMRRHEIGAADYFPCVHLQPHYRRAFGFHQGAFPVAESISARTIALPFFNRLDEPQMDLVCHTLRVMIQREQLMKR